MQMQAGTESKAAPRAYSSTGVFIDLDGDDDDYDGLGEDNIAATAGMY